MLLERETAAIGREAEHTSLGFFFTFFSAFGVWCSVINGVPWILTFKFSLQWSIVDSYHSFNLYAFPCVSALALNS